MLQRDQIVLVIVDVQGNLAQAMYEKEVLFDNLGRLIRGTQVLGIPIILVEQCPDKLGPTIPEIASLLEGKKPIAKKTFSCLGATGFARELAATGRYQVLLAGIEAHVCIYQTTAELIAQSYETYVVADAVSSRTQRNRDLALDKIKGLGAQLTSVEMALFEILRLAEGPQFKRIVEILK